jgi:hypothetical protein
MNEDTTVSERDAVTILPDGSAFGVMSLPLPRDHWSTAGESLYAGPPPMGLRVGTDAEDHQRLVEIVRAAGRYAYRAATMCGRETDLDPDALVQNFVVGLLGYHTRDGLSGDMWANPSPVPPRVTVDFNDV